MKKFLLTVLAIVGVSIFMAWGVVETRNADFQPTPSPSTSGLPTVGTIKIFNCPPTVDWEKVTGPVIGYYSIVVKDNQILVQDGDMVVRTAESGQGLVLISNGVAIEYCQIGGQLWWLHP